MQVLRRCLKTWESKKLKKFKYSVTFKKDIKRIKRRGKDFSKLKQVIDLIVRGESLPRFYRDHVLIGNYVHRRECHIENDWLLVYKLERESVVFERTGTHSDLFK